MFCRGNWSLKIFNLQRLSSPERGFVGLQNHKWPQKTGYKMKMIFYRLKINPSFKICKVSAYQEGVLRVCNVIIGLIKEGNVVKILFSTKTLPSLWQKFDLKMKIAQSEIKISPSFEIYKVSAFQQGVFSVYRVIISHVKWGIAAKVVLYMRSCEKQLQYKLIYFF